MRIVLDANVLIAAFISHGTCAELLEHCVYSHELISSESILKEFHDNLVTKFRVSGEDADEARRLLMSRMKVVVPSSTGKGICRDPKDELVLATAVAGDCRCIISGDKDLLVLTKYRNIDIVSPADFWSYEERLLGRTRNRQ